MKPANYAGFGVRFFAWLVDVVIMGVPVSLLYALRFTLSFADPYGFLSRAVFFRYTPLDLVILLLPAVYFTAMTLSYGATLGKMLLKLQVVSADGGGLKFWQVVLREFFGRYLSMKLLFIGYLMIAPDRQKRALHDRIADTFVVYAPGATVVRHVTAQNAPSTDVAPDVTAAQTVENVPVTDVSPAPAVETVENAPVTDVAPAPTVESTDVAAVESTNVAAVETVENVESTDVTPETAVNLRKPDENT